MRIAALLRLPCSLLSLCACASSSEHRHGHADHRGHPGMHRFEDAEKWAKTFDDPARDEWQKPDEIVAQMSIEPGMVVADLGAGTGYFLARLSRAVGPSGRVLGLDVEPDMVRYMTERAARESLTNVAAQRVPFDSPGLETEPVDRILVVDTWHHIDGREAYARKLWASLRPGGRLVIVDFTLEAERGPPREHRVSPEQAKLELEKAGFESELVEESLGEQYLLVGVRPLSVGD